MPADVLSFNKPCTVCRRRKVRCDKKQPCGNCARQRVACVYEVTHESATGQRLLHDRVERLEHMVESIAAMSFAGSAPHLAQIRGGSPRNSFFNSSNSSPDVPSDDGSHILYPKPSNRSVSDSWLDFDRFTTESNDADLKPYDDVGREIPSWPLGFNSFEPRSTTHFHLDTQREDVLISLFFDHVEPFIRISHKGRYLMMLADYRQGTCVASREVEALIFATQYITTAMLPSSLIHERLEVDRAQLCSQLQEATKLALCHADFMRSRNSTLLTALLYYITCQFHIGNCELASALLGVGERIARRIGMHRDSPRYDEIRRRIWGHMAALDAQSAVLDGSESTLLMLGDNNRSRNANDGEWTTSSLLGTQSAPDDREGFSDATAALIRRELSKTYNDIHKARRVISSCDSLNIIIEETEKYLRTKFIQDFDGSNPLQLVITHWSNTMIKSLYALVLYLHASPSRSKLRCHSFEQLRSRLYNESLSCLEELERGEQAATPHHWQWAFRWPIPIHCIMGLLYGLIHQHDHINTDRAWGQINVVFQRYNNDQISIKDIPAWGLVESMCNQAMLKHPNRAHKGKSYTKCFHSIHSPVGFCADHEVRSRSYLGSKFVEMEESIGIDPKFSQTFLTEAMDLGFPSNELDTPYLNLA